MTTAMIKKIKEEIKQELITEFLRPFMEQSKDPEGEYREEFVRGVLKAAKRKPRYTYDPKTFLKLIS